MTTPSTIFSQTRDQVAEQSAAFWTDTEIYRHMSDAENQIAMEIGCSQDTTSFSTGDGTREYTLDSDIAYVTRCTWDGVRQRQITVNDLSRYEGESYGSGPDTTGSSSYYYLYGNLIGFSPVPDKAATVRMWYNKVPDEITSTSTSFTIPAHYGFAVMDYTLWQMFVKDQQLQQEGQFYSSKFYQDIEFIRNDWFTRSWDDQFPQVTIVDPLWSTGVDYYG